MWQIQNAAQTRALSLDKSNPFVARRRFDSLLFFSVHTKLSAILHQSSPSFSDSSILTVNSLPSLSISVVLLSLGFQGFGGWTWATSTRYGKSELWRGNPRQKKRRRCWRRSPNRSNPSCANTNGGSSSSLNFGTSSFHFHHLFVCLFGYVCNVIHFLFI